jgi:voltage-gated potassium channel
MGARVPTVSRGRIAVLLTGVVAVFSVATGVVNIATSSVVAEVGPYVPTIVQEMAGFTGTMTGFILGAAAIGMRQRLRLAWRTAAVLLPVTLIQGVIQASPYSLPLIVLSLAAMPSVWLSRSRFERTVSLSTAQIAAGLSLVGVQVYGTVGAYAVRDHFTGIGDGSDGLLDAFYYTLVTASTVGYGDVVPITVTGRLFGLSVVILGTASFAVALGALLGPAIQARLAATLGRMTDQQLDQLEDHIIVLGYGDLSEPILEELTTAAEFVVVTPDSDTAAALRERGYTVLVDDPSDEAALERVQLGHAQAVVAATNSDADDALSVLTARQLRPDIRIVAAATERENVAKLRRAGADTVISPAVLGGHLIVQSALGREGMEELAADVLGEGRSG